MSDKKDYFLKMLKVELEELENEVIDLDHLYKERLSRHEITNYVFKENHVVLRNEIECSKRLHKELDSFEVNRADESLEQMEERLVVFILSFIREKQYLEGMGPIFLKKIEKIKKFVQM